jgi:hypothetical protein
MKQGKFCPLLKKDCIENKCAWYSHVRGFNPNTGQEVDEAACTVSWIPMLMIENSQQQRSTSAAVESFRNEMVKSNESNLSVLEAAANMYYDLLESQGVQVRLIEESENEKNNEEIKMLNRTESSENLVTENNE